MTMKRNSVVGAWHLQAIMFPHSERVGDSENEGAPILHSALTFHREGVVYHFQADSAISLNSESAGAGEWKAISKDQVKGAFLAFCYSRESHLYIGYSLVVFEVKVSDKIFRGRAKLLLYDKHGELLVDVPSVWSGTRILFSV